MNVLYLHGLESKPTGPKMKYLKDRFENYYAPEMIKEQTSNEAEIAAMIALYQFLEDKKIVRLPSN